MTFRIDGKVKDELDAIASELDRDRSYVLNQAVASYIETHRWQIAHIQQGLDEAKQQDFASDDEVRKALKKWRK